MHSRAVQWLLLLGTLGFAVTGQYYFARKPEFFWDAVMFYIIAVCFMVSLLREPRGGVAAGKTSMFRAGLEAWMRRAFLGVSLLVAGLVVVMLVRPRENYWPIFWMWVAAIMLCLLAYLPVPKRMERGRLGGWLRDNGLELTLVLMVVIGAFLLRAWRIETIPWTLSGDEGNFGRWAREVLDGRTSNMFTTGHLSMPSMYIFWQAAWLRLAGDNVVGLRLPWAFLGALSILGTYLLVRRLFGRELALLGAFLLAGYHYHLHYSRLGLNNIADPFFMAWSLYFLVVGCQDGKRWAWALSGILAGLAVYFYTGGRQVPLMLGAIFVWAAFVERGFWSRNRSGLAALVAGLVVTVGPIALYAVQHPDDFNARFNQIGVFQSGWLTREAALLGQSKLQIMAEQFRRVFFAFNFFRDRTDFYKPAIPLMDFASGIFFLLGLALSITRLIYRSADYAPDSDQPARKQPPWRYAVFVFWFFGVIIAGGVLTESAPSSQRIVSSAVPAVFFVSVALWELTSVVARLLGFHGNGHRLIVSTLAIALTALSLRYYFGPYQRSWLYGSFNGEVSTRIGYYLRDLGAGWKAYFFGAPRMYHDFGSSVFIAKDVQQIDVLEPLEGPPTFVDPSLRPVFVFLPERLNELEWVKQAYPDGLEDRVYRVALKEAPSEEYPLLFVAYRPN